MNKKAIYSLLMISILMTGCEKNNSSSVSSTGDTSSSERISDSSSSSLNSSSLENSSSSDDETNYVSIDDVSALFHTYNSSEDYDFSANYRCDAISNRNYLGGWETDYMFDGINLLLSYSDSDGSNYTDYFIYDENSDQMIYYLDYGNNLYKYLDVENEYYFNYVSLIDYFELQAIEWEDDMLFDLNNQVCIPVDNLTKDKIGRQIFGDNPNEYWHKVEISWEDGYISKVEAISIYQEVTYYYTVTLTDHGFAQGAVKVPDNVEKFTNPYQPYLKDKEEYTGVALTTQQADALTLFTNEQNMNYTADIRWNVVSNDMVLDSTYIDFKLLAENGNYEYSYADSQSSLLTHYFYLLSGSSSNYPVCFMDEDFDGIFTTLTYGMDEYESYVSQIYLDRVLLYGLNPEDFIYDEEKGYITAKDMATEEKYCSSLFFYENYYGGLRIYLKEDNTGNLVLDKIVTSIFMAAENGSYYSFVKTYTFTDIGTTSISYPDGVSLS